MRLLLLAFLVFNFNNAFCQGKHNSIEVNNIHINNRFNKTYSLGSPNELIKAFGKAKIIKEPDEVLGGYSYFYRYEGFETYFNEKNWETTQITGPKYVVLLNNIPYKVGDPVSKLKNGFPISYKHKEKIERDHYGIWIDIRQKKEFLDTYIFIDSNEKGFITEIRIANNNS